LVVKTKFDQTFRQFLLSPECIAVNAPGDRNGATPVRCVLARETSGMIEASITRKPVAPIAVFR
jgi:hypothetical protein